MDKTNHQFWFSCLDTHEKVSVILFFIVIGLVCIYGMILFLDYEGYFCQPVVIAGNTETFNLWCGHNHQTIIKNGKTYFETYGWAFGDFP